MPTSLTLGISEVRTLRAQAQNGGNNVSALFVWSNSDDTIVAMQRSTDWQSATVVGKAAGTSTVTVTIPGSGVSDTFIITVPATSPDTLTLSYQ